MSTIAKIPRTAEVYTKRETDLAIQQSVKPIKRDVESLLFAKYYPDGNVQSASEFTSGIKYNDPDTVNRTITVKPFCNTGDSANDNSDLSGRVVIPPFVDEQRNPHISDDGTRYRVVGVSNGTLNDANTSLTAIVAPNTVTNIGASAFRICTALTSISLPAATTIGSSAFHSCTSLTSVDFGDTPRSSVPSLGYHAFYGVPSTCKIIVPDEQYNDWTAETLPDESSNPWYALVTAGYRFLKHSEWEYARKIDIPYDRITITTGQLQGHAVQKVTLNAATTMLTLPALTDLTGKVSDFGIDMVNGYTYTPEVGGTPTPTAASFSLAGTIGTDYNLIVPEGEDWSEMSALAAGEMAQFYFTLSAFAVNDKPTWKIVKQVVELVPVPSAP